MIFIPLLRKKNPITCNMKKILVAIAAMLITFGASAQNYKTEISVSYGALSNSQILSAVIFAAGVENPEYVLQDAKFIGPISADLYFRTNKYFSFGLSGVYQHTTAKAGVPNGAAENFECRYYTLMPGMKLHWLRTNGFNMYSKLAVGATLASMVDANDSGWFVNFQVSPIGLEFGRNFCVFAEAGFGEQGIVLGGIRIKL